MTRHFFKTVKKARRGLPLTLNHAVYHTIVLCIIAMNRTFATVQFCVCVVCWPANADRQLQSRGCPHYGFL